MSLLLQYCAACGAAQYPRRDLCRVCLADALELRGGPDTGWVLARALVCRSLEPAFAAELPLAIGTVWLDAGVRALALLEGDPLPGARVAVRAGTNVLGQPILVARAEQGHG